LSTTGVSLLTEAACIERQAHENNHHRVHRRCGRRSSDSPAKVTDMSFPTRILLGTGALTWRPDERETSRYGGVYLIDDRQNSLTPGSPISLINYDAAKPLVGHRCMLFANVLKTRKSTHVGDPFRKLYPSIPRVGVQIVLGRGTFFVECSPHVEGAIVGVTPKNGRAKDWLDPRALYDTHEQTVELYFLREEHAPK
jgi:hypothetical protein